MTERCASKRNTPHLGKTPVYSVQSFEIQLSANLNEFAHSRGRVKDATDGLLGCAAIKQDEKRVDARLKDR